MLAACARWPIIDRAPLLNFGSAISLAIHRDVLLKCASNVEWQTSEFVQQGLNLSRRDQLKAATQDAHRDLDARVSTAHYFTSAAGYADWLAASYRFHAIAERALEAAGVATRLNDWSARKKTPLIALDLADLGMTAAAPVAGDDQFSLAGADACFGALYVIEGASMGARLLLVSARRLGMSAHHGARQLTAAAEGFAPWHTFVAALEAAPGTAVGEAAMIDAACRTFDLAASCFAGGSLAALRGSGLDGDHRVNVAG